MGGGLMQLVATGAQDIYLTGKPQITFFKSVYMRHTNFAIESIQQRITGTPQPNNRISITIARNGDLLKNIYIEFNASTLFNLLVTSDKYPGNEFHINMCSDFGHALFDTIELEIGGNVVDRHYGRWLTIWRDLTDKNEYGDQGFLNIANDASGNYIYGSDPEYISPDLGVIGYSTRYQKMSYTSRGIPNNLVDGIAYPLDSLHNVLSGAPKKVYVPLKFWFCRNPGLALPLVALQYHEVKLNVTFSPISSLFSAYTYFGGNKITLDANLIQPAYDNNITFYADYIFLDKVEREQFAKNDHDYLIDQLQYVKSTGSTIELPFKHCVKELIWTGSPYNYPFVITGPDTGPATPNFTTDPTYRPLVQNLYFKLVLNGADVSDFQHLNYYSRYQIWKYHTGFGATCNFDTIAVYSFAMNPELHQPSGTCNFTKLSSAKILCSGSSNNTPTGVPESLLTFDVYAVNYNIFKVASGMGGLIYSK